jgi:broad specificity phosphatase PhoE
MPVLVHLIRHGQSTFNQHYEATGIDPMHFDARLTPLGEQQVAEARKRLANNVYDVVLVSPLTRALQTAHGIFGDRFPMEITPLHSEWQISSCDIGRSHADLRADFPHLDFAHLGDPWWRHELPIGKLGFPQENEEDLMNRVETFKQMIRKRREKRIAVVGHGDFFRRLIGRSLNNCELAEWDSKS